MSRKVLHVHVDFEPERGGGGVARHIAGLAEATVGPAWRVRVTAPRVDDADGRGYEVVRAGWLGLVRHVAWADVVHVHGARRPLSAFAALLAFLGRRRVVYTPHCYYDDGGLLKRLAKHAWDRLVERFLLHRSDAVILLSAHWRDYLQTRRLPVVRAAIVPNCVVGRAVAAWRQPRGEPLDGQPALLSVGRLDPVKRLDDALRALTHPGLAKAVLHVVGRGPDHARLVNLAGKLGVAERVRFHGFVADAAVARLAAAANVFVMPSAAEGLPTVLIEMILMGVPVAASDIPGNRAVLDPVGLDGLFPLGDVAALADAVLRVAAVPVSDRAMALAAENFTWERVAPRVVALYGDGVETAA